MSEARDGVKSPKDLAQLDNLTEGDFIDSAVFLYN